MPINRTPPSTPTPDASSSTEPDLKLPTNNEPPLFSIFSQRTQELDLSTDSASKRVKRKHDLVDKNKIIDEIRALFSEFTDDQDKKFSSLRKSIEESMQKSIAAMRTDFAELTKSFDFLAKNHAETVENIKRLEKEREEDREYIQSLERSVEYLERKARSSCLEIRNMPCLDGAIGATESKTHLRDMIINLGSTLNTKIDLCEIKDVYRQQTGKKTIVRPITVEFTSVLKKEALLGSTKKFNKERKGSDKLNTSHLRIKGPSQPVFISESLTFKAKQLFRLAREFKVSHGYHHCWTANGIVYLRQKEGSPHIRVLNEADIKKLDNQK